MPPTFLAWVPLARGEADEALERLREAAWDKDPWLPFQRLVGKGLHPGDPRIEALLGDLGL